MGLALDFLNFDAMRRNNSRVYLVHEIVDGCVGNAHEVIAKNKQDAIDSIDRRCKQKPDEWYAEDITEMAMDYKNNVLTSLDGLVSELKKLKLADLTIGMDETVFLACLPAIKMTIMMRVPVVEFWTCYIELSKLYGA